MQTLEGLSMIFIGPDRLQAEARDDLTGVVPWPVFSLDTKDGPRFWRLDDSGEWPQPVEVTNEVQAVLTSRFLERRQRSYRETKERLARLKAEREEDRIVRAPQIRRARGDVKTETRVEIDQASGKVIGSRRGDRVQDWLRRHLRRREINRRQYLAGVRFQRVAERVDVGVPSQLDPQKLDAPRGTGRTPDLAFHALGSWAAMASVEFKAAVDAMGPALWPVVLWVVVTGRPATDWAKATGRPLRDGMAALRLGLDALADHYRLDK